MWIIVDAIKTGTCQHNVDGVYTCVCVYVHVYAYVYMYSPSMNIYIYIYICDIYIYSSMYYTSIKLHCHLLLCLDSTFIGSGFHADSTTTTHFGDPPNNVGFIFGAKNLTNHLENKATSEFHLKNSHESAPYICCLKFQAMFSEKCK